MHSCEAYMDLVKNSGSANYLRNWKQSKNSANRLQSMPTGNIVLIFISSMVLNLKIKEVVTVGYRPNGCFAENFKKHKFEITSISQNG